MEKETTYKLRCICMNCGKDFDERIKKGIEVKEIGGEVSPALLVLVPESPKGEINSKFIRCPECETLRVRKRLSLADMK